MKITKTFFTPIKGSSLKAFCSVTFETSDGVELVIKSFRVFEGKKGKWATFPSEQSKADDKWYDTVFVTDGDLKKEICNEIVERYEDFIEKGGDKKKASSSKSGSGKYDNKKSKPKSKVDDEGSNDYFN